MYVNQLGFQLEEISEDFVSIEKFKEITDWISGVEFVGEFTHSHPENILKIIQNYPKISFIEISEETYLPLLVNTGYGLILKVKIKSLEDIQQLISKSASFETFGVSILLDSDEKSVPQDWQEAIKTLAEACEVLIGFGLNSTHVNEIISNTGIKGIVLKGGKEIKPGLKDFDELADILEVIESEDY